MLVRRTISVFLLIVGILLVLHPLGYGNRTSEILREVMVMFKAGTLQFPKGLDSGNLDQVQILSPQVESILKRHRVEMILKAFPDFNLADTLGFTPDGQPVYLCDLSEIYKIRLPAGSGRDSLIGDLTALAGVVYAEPNGIAQPAAPLYPNDPLFEQGHQWGLYNYGQSGGTVDVDIDAPEAWEIATGSSNVKIGIIDGGVENWHEDLSGKVSGDGGWGWSGHGFHVAGIAAANTDNDIGIAGVNWNAQIISQRIDETDDEGTYDAIMDAVNAGADVLNNSWGLAPPGRYSTTVRLAFANAYKLNRVAAVAMGNDYNHGNPTVYPAGFGQGIIAVGGTDRWDGRYLESSTGNHIDVSAPGVDIMSCVPYQTGWGYYEPRNGTSMATPHVSGLASLLKGYNPDLYNDDIEQIIRISADTVQDMGGQEWTPEYGDGRINARKAFDLLRPPNYLAHWSVSGGYQTEVTDYYIQIFYGVPGLAAGPYYVKRYEVRHDVTFPNPFATKPYAWGRGAATTGYSAANPNFGMGYCHFVSLTSTGGTLRTWVYQVWTIGGDYVGWKPCSPGNVNFAYTALGQPSLLVPALSVSLVQEDSSHYFHLTWDDYNQFHDRYEVQMESEYTYWATVAILRDTCHSFDYTPAWGSVEYNFRVRAIRIAGEDSIYSEWSNGASILNVPNPPTRVGIAFRMICGWPNQTKVTPGYQHDRYSRPESAIVFQSFSENPDSMILFWDSTENQSDPLNVPEPGHDPPCFPSNKVYVYWSPPDPWDQLEPIDYYKIRIKTFIDGSPTVFWSGPIYTLKDSLCLWPYWEYWISVVAYVGDLHSDEMANARHVLTGSQICDDYSHNGSPPPDEEPEIPMAMTDLTPNQYSLAQNYPNPFNPETEISYALPNACHVKLSIYNLLGQRISIVVDENQAAGHKTVHWDGTDKDGNKVASGVYFYYIQANEFTNSKKMILMK